MKMLCAFCSEQMSLPPREVKFWYDLIEKYLKPLEKDKEKEKLVTLGLKELRNQMVFSFLMINSFYVVLITMLRLQSPLKIPWTIFTSFDLNGLDGVHYTFDYNPPENMESPLVTISRTTIVLDILGLVFLLTFTLITTFQVFGMFLHRWQTCKYFFILVDYDLLMSQFISQFVSTLHPPDFHCLSQQMLKIQMKRL